MKEWVVVACRAEAKIFYRENNDQDLQWIKTIYNKKGRKREHDFDTDRAGMSFAKFSTSQAPHRLESKHTHAEINAARFAQTIGNALRTASANKHFEKLTIFAGPSFLGKIRGEIADLARGLQIQFINKSLEKNNTDQIQEHIY